MNPELLRQGSIIRYPYLWRRQSDRGETEGRKDRPVCVLLAVRSQADGMTHLALLALSSQPPRPDQPAIDVPEIERRRAGLDGLRGAWIMLGEYNYDIAERSFYLDVDAEPLGRFSRPFVALVASAFVPFFTDGRNRVDRTD